MARLSTRCLGCFPCAPRPPSSLSPLTDRAQRCTGTHELPCRDLDKAAAWLSPGGRRIPAHVKEALERRFETFEDRLLFLLELSLGLRLRGNTALSAEEAEWSEAAVSIRMHSDSADRDTPICRQREHGCTRSSALTHGIRGGCSASPCAACPQRPFVRLGPNRRARSGPNRHEP